MSSTRPMGDCARLAHYAARAGRGFGECTPAQQRRYRHKCHAALAREHGFVPVPYSLGKGRATPRRRPYGRRASARARKDTLDGR